MQFRMVGRLLLMLACSTALTWAAQDPASTGDGGCRQIAGQLPHTASRFGYGLASVPRNAMRPNNLKWELPIAAATGLLIAASDDHINSHIQSLSFAQAASRGSNVGLGIELGTAGLLYLVGCSGHRSSYMQTPASLLSRLWAPRT
jgi:hypothetical protein